MSTIQTPCPFCTQTGKILTGWDEDGNEIFTDCPDCNGLGYTEYEIEDEEQTEDDRPED